MQKYKPHQLKFFHLSKLDQVQTNKNIIDIQSHQHTGKTNEQIAWFIDFLIVITLWIFLDKIWKVNWPFNTNVKFNMRAYYITKIFFKITLVNNYIQRFFKISWSYTWTKKTITTSRQFIATSITKKIAEKQKIMKDVTLIALISNSKYQNQKTYQVLNTT